MTPEYLFARHGESEANITRTISNRSSDYVPLTELGKAQARELLCAIRKHKIAAIYTSPLTSARETAEIIASGLDLEVEIADALREPDCGEIEGRSDAAAWKMHADQEQAWRSGRHDHQIAGGESLYEVRDRFIPFVERTVSEHGQGGALFVSHGSVLTNVLPLVLPNVRTDFVHDHPLGNCEYVVATATAHGLLCVSWGGVACDAN